MHGRTQTTRADQLAAARLRVPRRLGGGGPGAVLQDGGGRVGSDGGGGGGQHREPGMHDAVTISQREAKCKYRRLLIRVSPRPVRWACCAGRIAVRPVVLAIPARRIAGAQRREGIGGNQAWRKLRGRRAAGKPEGGYSHRPERTRLNGRVDRPGALPMPSQSVGGCRHTRRLAVAFVGCHRSARSGYPADRGPMPVAGERCPQRGARVDQHCGEAP